MNQFSKNMVPNFYMLFITIFFWKYQWGNQKPSIKDEQGNASAKRKQEKDIQSTTRQRIHSSILFPYHMLFESFNSGTTGANSGTHIAYNSGISEFIPDF
jgi:hypothetical protein